MTSFLKNKSMELWINLQISENVDIGIMDSDGT